MNTGYCQHGGTIAKVDIKIKEEIKTEDAPLDAVPEYCGYGKLSVITGPYMRLTTEEASRCVS